MFLHDHREMLWTENKKGVGQAVTWVNNARIVTGKVPTIATEVKRKVTLLKAFHLIVPGLFDLVIFEE